MFIKFRYDETALNFEGGMFKMRKHSQNLYIDLLSFICMIVLLLTGILMRYILPPGSGSANIWGLTRHEWGDIHFWIAVIFAITITVHLILHLPWIKASLIPSSTKKVSE